MAGYRIAGLPVDIESADREFFDRRLEEYADGGSEPAQLSLHSERRAKIDEPTGVFLCQGNGTIVLQTDENRFVRFTRTKSGCIPIALYYTGDYSEMELFLTETSYHKTLSLTDLEYIYTGQAFRNRLSVLGDGVLHSSAIAYRGQGLAFTADSGTGKSTHTGLWRQEFSADTAVVNDDKPAIRFENGKIWMYGTPWSGKTDLNHNIRVPLRGIVCVRRGETDRIAPMDPVKAMSELTRQCPAPFYDRALGEKMLDFTCHLAEQVPLYELFCTMNPNAAHVARDGIFEEQEEQPR